jgi:hypothetical protein
MKSKPTSKGKLTLGKKIPQPAFDSKRGQADQLLPTPSQPMPQRKQLGGNKL